jgi:hypothetical protein
VKFASSPRLRQFLPSGWSPAQTVAASLVHFVVAVRRELNGIAVTGTMDGAGNAAEDELAPPLPPKRM